MTGEIPLHLSSPVHWFRRSFHLRFSFEDMIALYASIQVSYGEITLLDLEMKHS
jgi:hypothetical protein